MSGSFIELFFFAYSDIICNFAVETIIFRIMEGKETIKKTWTREDFLALLERGRQIKARRQKEAEEKYAERMRRRKEAAESGYYDLEWV